MLVFDKGPIIIDTEMENVKKLKWYSTDNFINSMRNPKRKLWEDEPISYNFNKWGYRSVELDDIDVSDFLLTFGCSYSEGVGLHEHQIWVSHIKKYTGYELFNASKQGTGPDIQAYNTMKWIQSKLPLPKLVIIQWPYKARKSFATSTKEGISLKDRSENLSNLDGSWWTKRYIVDKAEMHNSVLTWFELTNYMWESQKVPVLNFSWDEDFEPIVKDSKFKLHHIQSDTHDRARDGIHDGPIIHKNTSEKLIQLLESSNFTYKI